MKLAIMQPYFIPYSGYFRLFCAADLFVVYDCVQFPRRGWIHRNKLMTKNKTLDWLTLPLIKQPIDTSIKDLKFRNNVQDEWRNNISRFQVLNSVRQKYPELFKAMFELELSPVNYIVNCLRVVCSILAIPFNIAYSSELALADGLKGQDRILEIARHFSATDYINAPGGRALYSENDFFEYGINLHFLTDYKGDFCSVIQCLAEQDPIELSKSLYAQV